MKPKTRFEKLIVETNKRIPKLTSKQIAWAIENVPEKYFSISRNRIFCLECGHKYYDHEIIDKFKNHDYGYVRYSALAEKPFEYIHNCPSCNTTVKYNNRRYHTHCYDFCIVSVYGTFQVIRVFEYNKFINLKSGNEYYINEFARHFIDPSGKKDSMTRITSYSDGYTGNIELRSKKIHTDSNFFRLSGTVYPVVKTLAIIKRNGFKSNFHEMSPQWLFYMLLNNPKAETLFKAGQYGLLQHLSKATNYWRTIRICLRNNYIVHDAGDWLDYIQMLKKNGYDILNRVYVCPDNFKEAHDNLVALLNKKKIDKDLAIAKAKTPDYIKAKGKYLKWKIEDNNLVIVPLKSVEEFLDHSMKLKHCIYRNEYFKNNDSLVLGIYIDNMLTENADFNLKTLTVSQSRGMSNVASEHNQLIVKTINNKLPDIIRKLKKKKIPQSNE